MSVSLHSAFLAEAAILDVFTSRLSAINILEAVSADVFPAMVSKLCAIGLYTCPNETRALLERVSVFAPSGELILESLSQLEFSEPTHQSVHVFSRVKMQVPGEHRVRWLVTTESGEIVADAQRSLHATVRPPAEIAPENAADDA